MVNKVFVGGLEHVVHHVVGVVPPSGHNCLWVPLSQGLRDHPKGFHDIGGEGVHVVQVVCWRLDSEHSVDVGSVAPMGQHCLSEVGPCGAVVSNV